MSAFPVDGTWPVGTAQWEKRNIALEIPVWDPAICIQCNKCALVCPHAAIRAKVYDPAALAGAPADVQVRPTSRAPSSRARRTRSRSRPRTAPAATSASTSARPRTSRTRGTRRSTCARSRRSASRSATNYAFFLDLPEPTRDGGQARRQGLAVPRAALRVLGRLRRLRRDAVPQAADAALRRPRCSIANATGCSSIYGGNLPTTPYTDEPRRARPGLVELALRGQRGVRPRHAPRRSTAHARRRAALAERPRPRGSATTCVAALLDADQSTRRASRRSASACARCAQALAGARRRRGAAPRRARRLPREEERLDRRRRRLGLRHRLRRPRPRPRRASAT